MQKTQTDNYTVYIHINKTNGKKYIGITRQKPERRWQNGHGYEKTVFWNAIQKYGWNGFEHKIIISGVSKGDACKLEKYLIESNKTNMREYGYNISEGGQTCDCIEKKCGEEHPNHQRVKMIDPYTKEVIAIFGAQSEAARKLGISRKGITKACQGKGCATYKGYIWEYADKKYAKPENVGIGNYDHSNHYKPVRVEFSNGRIKQYQCLRDACVELNVNYSTARRYVLKNYVDKEGRGWCYA